MFKKGIFHRGRIQKPTNSVVYTTDLTDVVTGTEFIVEVVLVQEQTLNDR